MLSGYFVLTKYVVYVLGGIDDVIAVNRYHMYNTIHAPVWLMCLSRGNHENHTSSRKFYWASYKNCMIFLAPLKRDLLDTSPLLCARNISTEKSEENHTTVV